MDIEEMILERDELSYEDPSEGPVETRHLCEEDYNYHNCEKCTKACLKNMREYFEREAKKNGNNYKMV